MAASPPHPTDALRIRVHGEDMVPAASAATAAAAEALGLAVDDADRLGRAVDVTCRQALAAGFDDPATAELDVEVRTGAAGVALRISDEGLPFTLRTESDVAARVAAATTGADDVPLVEHVRVDRRDEGTSIELQVRPDPSVLDHLAAADAVGTDPVDDDADVTCRELRQEDCESLARCVWRVYRYTYVADYLYHPARVWSLVEQGWLRSWVALDASGEVVGHIGLILDEPDTRVADASLALTDPRYRHHRVMEQLGGLMYAAVADLALVGTFAEAVTAHTITQRGMVESGGVETGILLGFIPATMSYRGILEDLGGNRQSAVLGYHAVRPAPPRRVALPERYADELRGVYERGALDRTEIAPAPAAAGATTTLHLDIDRPRRLTTIVVDTAGDDVVDLVDRHRRELCAAGMELVYAELPLGDPGAAAAVDGLVERGFFYGGVIPELRDGDVLRLQYLDVDVDPTVLHLYSDEAERLLAYTLADRA